MGTGRPQVEIAAATLAGGDKNQDRYAYGDGWAFVLDGASSFAKTQPAHDGGWYAEHLKQSLTAGLERSPDALTSVLVEDAIRAASDAHGDPESCPTSTIALARWSSETVEVYVLGDSTAVIIGHEGEEEVSDSRLDVIAQPIREKYHSRLVAGYGFDEQHHKLLQQLQAHQAAARNRLGGYWIAGADPNAAQHALFTSCPASQGRSVVLATDGAASGLRYGLLPAWGALASSDIEGFLRLAQDEERADGDASRWPRSKLHDDKTIVIAEFHALSGQ